MGARPRATMVGMTPRPASLLAGWAIALLAAGDAVRYTVGYAGWAVLCGLNRCWTSTSPTENGGPSIWA